MRLWRSRDGDHYIILILYSPSLLMKYERGGDWVRPTGTLDLIGGTEPTAGWWRMTRVSQFGKDRVKGGKNQLILLSDSPP